MSRPGLQDVLVFLADTGECACCGDCPHGLVSFLANFATPELTLPDVERDFAAFVFSETVVVPALRNIMHGLIFLELQKFVKHAAGADTWALLHQEAGLPLVSYSPARTYPDELVGGLVSAASSLLGIAVPDLLKAFGKYLGPSLLKLYARIIDPQWTTLDLLENTERMIHSTVRIGNPGARPPHLECMRTTPDEVIIVYASERKMCHLAEGIIAGIAEHYQERVEVAHDACMHRGDPFCSIHVARRTPESARATQLGPVRETLHEQLAAPLQQATQEFTPQPASRHLDDRTLLLGEADHHSSFGDFSSGSLSPEPLFEMETRSFLSPPLGPDELGRLGRFSVIGVLGRGGMGIVLRAKDPHLERPVAIKVMSPLMAASATARQRFLREARAMASISSRHLVTIYEVGLAHDHPFIAMELLEGETVLARQRRLGRLPVPEVLRIGKDSAQGLSAIHERGYVHRDIAPNNLWLTAAGDELRILDFGLTRELTSGSSLTRAGAILGTPAYMSPESVRGEVVDGRSDLFSLGCVLYTLSTGEQAFPGSDLLSAISALMLRTPPAPGELVPEIPASLSELLMRMIARQCDDRPASALEVVRDLEQLEASYLH
jgi:hypothetical protein